MGRMLCPGRAAVPWAPGTPQPSPQPSAPLMRAYHSSALLNSLWQEFLYPSSATENGFAGPEGAGTVASQVLSAVTSAGNFPARFPVPRRCLQVMLSPCKMCKGLFQLLNSASKPALISHGIYPTAHRASPQWDRAGFPPTSTSKGDYP